MSGDEQDEQKMIAAVRKRGRRRAISAASPQSGNTKFTPKVVKKSDADVQRLKEAIEHSILFKHLSDDDRKLMIDAISEQKYKKGDVVIQQGDEGDNFYIVDSGVCDCYVGDVPVMTCRSGDSFGELALMYDAPRAATVKATTDVKLWAIDRETYKYVILDSMLRKRKLYEHFLSGVPLMKTLEKGEISRVADCLEEKSYPANHVILKEGQTGDEFFIIMEGSVKCTQKYSQGSASNNTTSEGELCRLKAGQYFGEIALVRNTTRKATVTTLEPTKCLMLTGETFENAMGPLMDYLQRNVDVYQTYEQMLQA
eukprot:CAMPEP_0201552750 /NCGR_PEP_ID=MMETSP0173_2-20130828/17318_1 /ASSEMBLY_ACC=CAM_ASM_000268 /TAXON_ID=218659 /ORGANISM="Vexillifera sp., Strain DIVA3 564/2" /LENGTH=311 /DNA_ID=CAMNT_0047963287 /DNA_START=33 /DNA_END=968 /DNA_ORIENTATION=+